MRVRSYASLLLALGLILCPFVRLHGAPRMRPNRSLRPRTPVRRLAPQPRPLGIFERFPEFCGPCSKDKTERPLYRQNEIADMYLLHRLEKNAEISEFLKNGTFVPIPSDETTFFLDPRLKSIFHYAHPSVLNYIRPLAASHAELFSGRKFKITSLVRPRERQQQIALRWVARRNGKKSRNIRWVPAATDCNAMEYGHCSVHDTGLTFDLSTRGLSDAEIWWLAEYLKKDWLANRILAIYEPHGANFHIMVLPEAIALPSSPPHPLFSLQSAP